MQREDAINISAVESESKALMQTLGQELEPAALAELASMGLKYRLGNVNGALYYSALQKLAAVKKIMT